MYSYTKLSNSPNRSFMLTIPGDAQSLTLKIKQSYNKIAGYWTMDIYDSSANTLVLGVPMLCGYDLLSQYQYLNIGSCAIVNIGDPSISTPDNTSMADNFVLVWRL